MRLVAVDLAKGETRWKDGAKWLPKVRRLVFHGGLLACEVSSLKDDGAGNVLHVLSAADGNSPPVSLLGLGRMALG